MTRKADGKTTFEVNAQCNCGEWLGVMSAEKCNGVINIIVRECEWCAAKNQRDGFVEGFEFAKEA